MNKGTILQQFKSLVIQKTKSLIFFFIYKDGTLDGSRLFNNAQQFFPKVTFGAVKIFATKNNTKVLAHAGSTVVLPCTVAEESKFEMVSMFLHQKTLIHSFFQYVVFLSKTYKDNYQIFVNW